ncbi:uncharacterized protein LOC144110918 [Amblyomma americanum]
MTCALVFVCDDLCYSLDEGQLLTTVLPFLMPTEPSEVSLARLAYASTALQRLPELSNVTADKKITAALETEDVDTIAELLLADLGEAAGKIDQPLTVVHSPSLKHQVHFLGGLWLLHLDASCRAVASSSRQGASPSLPKEKLQYLALAVSAQLLQTAEDIKRILVEQNLVPSCCHYCRQYKGSESWLSAWHRRH